jgi:hypothetical protein
VQSVDRRDILTICSARRGLLAHSNRRATPRAQVTSGCHSTPIPFFANAIIMKSRAPQFVYILALSILSGCASQAKDDALGGAKYLEPISLGEKAAQITFSADKRFESESGSPRSGKPYICEGGTVTEIPRESSTKETSLQVRGGKEVVVTSVISWTNTGFSATCGPFVAFVPAEGQHYAVVNELVGGKGFKSLWTGIGRQTCEVSVYKLTGTEFSKIETQPTTSRSCKAPG